ncbi:MAG: DUF1127 domain-containing protein [Alphaproteobacteria bacterium]|nr:DUF1127 domain-containing protein [Alphaproteobacteria bacterium]
MTILTVDTNRQGISLKDMIADAAFAVISFGEDLVERVSAEMSRRATIRQINGLSDAMLNDIGLTRGDVEKLVKA